MRVNEQIFKEKIQINQIGVIGSAHLQHLKNRENIWFK